MKRYVLLLFFILAPGGYMNQAGALPPWERNIDARVRLLGSSLSGQGCHARSRVLHQLGFKLDQPDSPAFALVSIGDLKVTLSGPGGKQIQLEDPDGNPIEVFEPADR